MKFAQKSYYTFFSIDAYKCNMNTQIMHLQMTEIYYERFTFTEFNLWFLALNSYKFMLMVHKLNFFF